MKAVYFAWVRERIGKAEEEVDPPASVATVADLIGWPDQDHADPVLLESPAGPLDDLARSLVAAHGVDGDGQGGQRLE